MQNVPPCPPVEGAAAAALDPTGGIEGLEDRTVPSPIVTGLSPNFGPVSGGTAVEIAGSGFTGTTAVDFGSDITEYQVVSDMQIDVRSPGESAGVVDVTVTTPSGTSPTSSADQFTYGTTTAAALSSSTNPSTCDRVRDVHGDGQPQRVRHADRTSIPPRRTSGRAPTRTTGAPPATGT